MMPRKTLGELEHQVLLAVLRLGGEAYSVPLVLELEERTGREVAQAAPCGRSSPSARGFASPSRGAIGYSLLARTRKPLNEGEVAQPLAESNTWIRKWWTKSAYPSLANHPGCFLWIITGFTAISPLWHSARRVRLPTPCNSSTCWNLFYYFLIWIEFIYTSLSSKK